MGPGMQLSVQLGRKFKMKSVITGDVFGYKQELRMTNRMGIIIDAGSHGVWFPFFLKIFLGANQPQLSILQ